MLRIICKFNCKFYYPSNNQFFFRFLLHSRTLYMLILTTYYANITELVFHENPNLVPEEQILTEIEQCESDIEEIEKAADSVVGGCFMAIINSKANLGR